MPELLQAAEDARTQAGYSKRDRRLGGHDGSSDFWIECDISANGYKPGATGNPVESAALTTVQIQLTAPTSSPERLLVGSGRAPDFALRCIDARPSVGAVVSAAGQRR